MEAKGSPAPVLGLSSTPTPPSMAPTTFEIQTEIAPGPSSSTSPAVLQKCTRCAYMGPVDSYPPRRTGTGHLKVCIGCMDKQVARKSASTVDSSGCGQIATAAMSLDDFLKLVTLNKGRPFDFDTMVNLPPGMFAAGEHLYNRTNKIRDFLAEASEYHWNQKKTKRGGKSTVVTYFCAQLEGEQSKSRNQDADRAKSRSRITRYHCGGWLRITTMDDNELLLRIRMTHAEAHPSFPASFRKSQSGEFKMETTPKPVPKQPLFTTAPMTVPVGVTEVPQLIPRDDMGLEDDGLGPMLEQPQGNGGPPPSIPEVYFSPDQLAGLRRKFDAMMSIASGPCHPDLAHALGSVFDHLDRTVGDIEVGRFAKRRRIS